MFVIHVNVLSARSARREQAETAAPKLNKSHLKVCGCCHCTAQSRDNELRTIANTENGLVGTEDLRVYPVLETKIAWAEDDSCRIHVEDIVKRGVLVGENRAGRPNAIQGFTHLLGIDAVEVDDEDLLARHRYEYGSSERAHSRRTPHADRHEASPMSVGRRFG